MDIRQSDRVTAQFVAAETLIPESGGNLALLARDLQSIERLGLPSPRGLLGADLDILRESVTRITAMRSRGHNPEDMAPAVFDMLRLAMDMRAKAAKALKNEAREISLHASVGAMHAEGGDPADLTREFRLVAAMPAPESSDRPGVLAPTGFSPRNGVFGRIAGGYVAFNNRPMFNDAAPAKAVILPPGSAVHFEKGESFFLYSRGIKEGDRFTKPDMHEPQERLIEAGEGGIVLHGPAVIAKADIAPGILGRVAKDLRKLEPLIGEQARIQNDSQDDDQQWMTNSFAFTFFTIVFLGAAAVFRDVGPLVLAAVAAATAAGSFFLAKKNGWNAARAWARFLEMVPDRIRTGQTESDLRQFRPHVGAQGDLTADRVFMRGGKKQVLPPGLVALTRKQVIFGSSNFIPADRIELAPGENIRIMEPLPALPAPPPDVNRIRPIEEGDLIASHKKAS